MWNVAFAAWTDFDVISGFDFWGNEEFSMCYDLGLLNEFRGWEMDVRTRDGSFFGEVCARTRSGNTESERQNLKFTWNYAREIRNRIYEESGFDRGLPLEQQLWKAVKQTVLKIEWGVNAKQIREHLYEHVITLNFSTFLWVLDWFYPRGWPW